MMSKGLIAANLISCQNYASPHDRAVQKRLNQSNYANISNALLQAAHPDVVIDPIKDFLQINI